MGRDLRGGSQQVFCYGVVVDDFIAKEFTVQHVGLEPSKVCSKMTNFRSHKTRTLEGSKLFRTTFTRL